MNQHQSRVLFLSQVNWADGNFSKVFDGASVEIALDTLANDVDRVEAFIAYYENRSVPVKWIERMSMMRRFTNLGMLLHYAKEAGYEYRLLRLANKPVLKFSPVYPSTAKDEHL